MKVAFVGNPGHFHNEIDSAGSVCLGGEKVVKFTPWKIISSSPLGTPRFVPAYGRVHKLGCANKNGVYLLPEQLDKEVTTPYFTALGVHSQFFPRSMQITNMLVQLELSRFLHETTAYKNEVYLLPNSSMRKWRHCTFLFSMRNSLSSIRRYGNQTLRSARTACLGGTWLSGLLFHIFPGKLRLFSLYSILLRPLVDKRTLLSRASLDSRSTYLRGFVSLNRSRMCFVCPTALQQIILTRQLSHLRDAFTAWSSSARASILKTYDFNDIANTWRTRQRYLFETRRTTVFMLVSFDDQAVSLREGSFHY